MRNEDSVDIDLQCLESTMVRLLKRCFSDSIPLQWPLTAEQLIHIFRPPHKPVKEKETHEQSWDIKTYTRSKDCPGHKSFGTKTKDYYTSPSSVVLINSKSYHVSKKHKWLQRGSGTALSKRQPPRQNNNCHCHIDNKFHAMELHLSTYNHLTTSDVHVILYCLRYCNEIINCVDFCCINSNARKKRVINRKKTPDTSNILNLVCIFHLLHSMTKIIMMHQSDSLWSSSLVCQDDVIRFHILSYSLVRFWRFSRRQLQNMTIVDISCLKKYSYPLLENLRSRLHFCLFQPCKDMNGIYESWKQSTTFINWIFTTVIVRHFRGLWNDHRGVFNSIFITSDQATFLNDNDYESLDKWIQSMEISTSCISDPKMRDEVIVQYIFHLREILVYWRRSRIIDDVSKINPTLDERKDNPVTNTTLTHTDHHQEPIDHRELVIHQKKLINENNKRRRSNNVENKNEKKQKLTSSDIFHDQMTLDWVVLETLTHGLPVTLGKNITMLKQRDHRVSDDDQNNDNNNDDGDDYISTNSDDLIEGLRDTLRPRVIPLF